MRKLTLSGSPSATAQWKAEATNLGEMRLPPHAFPSPPGIEWPLIRCRMVAMHSGNYILPHGPKTRTIQGNA